jgi:citrate synthase
MPHDASNDSLHLRDSRTGRELDVPITNDTIRAMDLRQIRVNESDFGMMSYDPAFKNTVSCTSRITYIDGARGVLEYRGYPIAQLAEHATFPDVCWLLLEGEYPTPEQSEEMKSSLARLSELPENLSNLHRTLEGFPRDAHPMTVLGALLFAASGSEPDSGDVRDVTCRRRHSLALIARTPVLAAMVWRHRKGLPMVAPHPSLSYAGNFLRMVFADADGSYELDPVLERAMDVLFTLHADHEQNCSTSTMRVVGSSEARPYSSAAAAVAALSGPLHGGANEAVLKMLAEIGSTAAVPAFMEKVKNREAKLMGFGHRVYKSYDPRAKIISEIAKEVFEVRGRNPLLDIAVELERIALAEEFFKSRNLYPNVDFYSGLIYQSMGFDPEYFTVLFAVGRMVGWVAQWDVLMADDEQKIARPRQVYAGERGRSMPGL